jgi:hypothetical protein
MKKVYVGDSVYVARTDSGVLVLTTEDGIYVSNHIILEPDVWEALKKIVDGGLLDAQNN